QPMVWGIQLGGGGWEKSCNLSSAPFFIAEPQERPCGLENAGLVWRRLRRSSKGGLEFRSHAATRGSLEFAGRRLEGFSCGQIRAPSEFPPVTRHCWRPFVRSGAG